MNLKKRLKTGIKNVTVITLLILLGSKTSVHGEHVLGDCGGVISEDGQWEVIGDLDNQNASSVKLIDYRGTKKIVTVPDVLEGHPVTSLELSFNEVEKIIINGKNLKEIYYDNDDNTGIPYVKEFQVKNNPYFSVKDGVLFDKSKKTLIAYPEGKKGTSYTVPKKTVKIGAYAFAENTKLINVSMSKSVKTIEKGAFLRCKKMKKINLNQVKRIGEQAFFCCTKLKMVKGGSKLKEIGDEAYYGCSSLKEITLGKNVKKLGQYVFYDVANLKKIILKMKKTPKFDDDKAHKSNAFCGLSKKCKIYVENKGLEKTIKKLKCKGKVYVRK